MYLLDLFVKVFFVASYFGVYSLLFFIYNDYKYMYYCKLSVFCCKCFSCEYGGTVLVKFESCLQVPNFHKTAS